ncbi:MAG TPA: DNA methyltransferase [Acidimicrobiales bacterium]|nr:DNA methyltransferase [Acidimicrobiales bacterium]
MAGTDWSGARFLVGDVFDRLADIPDGSVDVIVTSPPFLALRSYLPADHPDKAKEVGAEPTPAAFLDTLLALTAEWRRVLAPHGSLCVELGDTYAGSGGGGGDYLPGGLREGQPGFGGSAERAREGNAAHWRQKNAQKDEWPLDKSLCGIPSLYAWSLAYGRNLLNPAQTIDPWRVRNLIVWTRPNPPVGALGDKCRPASSYITTACTGRARYFDMDAERSEPKYGIVDTTRRACDPYEAPGQTPNMAAHPAAEGGGRINSNPAGAPLLDHWNVPTQPYTGSHYAVWPEELPRRLISLMCPQRVCQECGKPSERITERSEDYAAARAAIGDFNDRAKGQGLGGSRSVLVKAVGRDITSAENITVGWTDCGHNAWRLGTVLDPFAGSGTTLAVAVGMGRRAVGIDIDARNAHLAEQRVGMFLEVA